MNNKQTVGGNFCDLQKAFDCVNHKILLDKLEFYGIKGIFKTLIKSYLNGRHKWVVLGHITDSNNTSKWEIIKGGVPHGSINNMVLYADDTSIIITDTNNVNFETNLNQTFKDINTWFNVNLLTLNLNKTQYLEFRSINCCNTMTQINCDQKSISNVTETNFLGLTIDDILSWKQHIDLMINRLSSTCYA
jgi:hypothetical protein